jgi:hypothetical protein
MSDQTVTSFSSYRASRDLLNKLGDSDWDVRHLNETQMGDGTHLVFLYDLKSGFSIISHYDYRLDNARTDTRFRNQYFCEDQLQSAIQRGAMGNLSQKEKAGLAALVSSYILHSGYFEMLRKYERSYAGKGRNLSILIFRHDRDINRAHALLLAPHGLLKDEILKPGELHSLANRHL